MPHLAGTSMTPTGLIISRHLTNARAEPGSQATNLGFLSTEAESTKRALPSMEASRGGGGGIPKGEDGERGG
jgi:hypothetical protein